MNKSMIKTNLSLFILIPIGALLAIGIFVMDLALPLGIAGGVPYVAVVLLGLWAPGKRYIVIAATAATALTILGFYFSPPGGEMWQVIFNRALALFAIWVAAILCLWHSRAGEEIKALSKFPSENPNPVLRCAQDGKLLYANSSAIPLLRDWNCEVGQMIPPHLRQLAEEVSVSRSTKTIEIKSGTRTFLFDIAPIPEARYINFYGHDITARKRAEKQREKLLKDLERANNELKDFAYIVSHDLKEPLRGISSLAQWIVEDYSDILDDAGRKQLRLLKENTQRMHHLIEGILAFSRIGQEKPVPVRLDSGKQVQEVIASLSKPDNFRILIDGTLPEVVYHQTHLEQIFQNLIGNAIKYLGKPSGEITVSCREDGQFWEFCVRDNGVGIEERHLDRIFKIFQTLGKKNSAESTGVGLSLVKKITENHEGKVRVESTVGQGSSFFFTIPKTIEKSDEL